MAVDTANKRASVQGYTFAYVNPAPDGTVDAADRAAVAGYYAGLTYQTEAPSDELTHNDESLEHNNINLEHQSLSLRHLRRSLEHNE